MVCPVIPSGGHHLLFLEKGNDDCHDWKHRKWFKQLLLFSAGLEAHISVFWRICKSFNCGWQILFTFREGWGLSNLPASIFCYIWERSHALHESFTFVLRKNWRLKTKDEDEDTQLPHRLSVHVELYLREKKKVSVYSSAPNVQKLGHFKHVD